jgi:hypothetical protein
MKHVYATMTVLFALAILTSCTDWSSQSKPLDVNEIHKIAAQYMVDKGYNLSEMTVITLMKSEDFCRLHPAIAEVSPEFCTNNYKMVAFTPQKFDEERRPLLLTRSHIIVIDGYSGVIADYFWLH